MGLLTMGLGHVCLFFGWLGVSASGHGFVSGWLGEGGEGGRVMVVYGGGGFAGGGEVLSVSMLPLHGISEKVF